MIYKRLEIKEETIQEHATVKLLNLQTHIFPSPYD